MILQDKDLKGKHILFIAPAFFNYEIEIKKKMEEMGAVVYFYDERPMKNSIFRALIKVAPSLFKTYSYNYFHNILELHKNNQIDYVLVIKSEMIPISILKEFKTYFKDAKKILYLYDSVDNLKGTLDRAAFYDKVVTFDRIDAKAYSGFHFRPLFYTDDYVCNSNSEKYEYDLAFFGTIHSDRYKILKQIKAQASQYKLRGYWFFYLQAAFMFYWYCLTKPYFKLSEKNEFTTQKLSSSQIANQVSKTKVIIDIESPGQNGLTMRTIEMLGQKKKLITTNPEVRFYDFYNPDNILIVDRDKPQISLDFMEKPYRSIPDSIYNKYHISSWIIEVLG